MQLFSNIQSEIISKIFGSTDSLKIAVTWFTNHDLFDAVIKKLDTPGFQVDLIVLNDRINNKKEGVDFQKLVEKGANFYYCSTDNMVHHKFCIIDSKIVITGSYNWTYYAENRNWENIVILSEPEIVRDYIDEFEKVKLAHERVENVSEKQKLSLSMNTNDYLETDYLFQAKTEEKKGNDLNAAKIYTEILRLNNKQTEIVAARKEIVNKYNQQQFEVSPFEIGILYVSGYSMAIPAFVRLPFTAVKVGRTTTNDASSLQVTIQKNDYLTNTILQFSMDHLKVCPEGTEKLEITLILGQNGILTVNCRELIGYNRTKSLTVDIKNWL
jgi:hypothetical protein